jgi:hypothetical protein
MPQKHWSRGQMGRFLTTSDTVAGGPQAEPLGDLAEWLPEVFSPALRLNRNMSATSRSNPPSPKSPRCAADGAVRPCPR